jgi:hypothetical protein
MNGRLERMDCLELTSEMNFNVINEELEAERHRRIRRRIEGWLAFAGFVAYMWFVIWGAGKNL